MVRSTRPLVRVALPTLVAAALALPVPARAELGGDAASVRRDAEKLHGELVVRGGAARPVHEIRLETGLVREHLAPSGRVFAVSWRGAGTPDLEQVLGFYYSDYRAALQRHFGTRHAVRTREGDLVIEVVRRPRGGHGRVWLRDLAPAGFGEDGR